MGREARPAPSIMGSKIFPTVLLSLLVAFCASGLDINFNFDFPSLPPLPDFHIDLGIPDYDTIKQRLTDITWVHDARSDYNASFVSWKQSFNTTYSHWEQEHNDRLPLFQKVLDACYDHNLKNASFWMRPGPYADRNETEMSAKFGGPNGLIAAVEDTAPPPSVTHHHHHHRALLAAPTLPDAVNWNTSGFVTPVKNQGQCGCCYSFAAAAAIETINAINNNNPTEATSPDNLSNQQIVDCSGSLGNMGCEGGYISASFQYAINNGGLTSLTNYPYTSDETLEANTCQSAKAAQIDQSITGWSSVKARSVSALQTAVAQTAVAVGIAASTTSFQNYAGGVYDDFAGCGYSVDHAVTVVGYESNTSTPHWIVKNSWGTAWGMNGYVLMTMTIPTSADVPNTPVSQLNTGICSILSQPVMPLLVTPPRPPPAPIAPPYPLNPPGTLRTVVPPPVSQYKPPPPLPLSASRSSFSTTLATFTGAAMAAVLLMGTL